jgi:protein arginine N-methyltransferase 1
MPATLDEHYSYLTDRVKLERYRAAIARLAGPGTTVLDLGCGSGLLGLIALRAGADKVLFLDHGPIIEVARRAVREAGFADRAEFFQASSFDIVLPEPVDFVVCDHVGYFGFDYGVLALLEDARNRFLRPGGTIVPSKLDLKLAPAESESSRALVQRWRDDDVAPEFRWVATPAANATHGVNLDAESLLAASADLATLALGEAAGEYLSWQASFIAERDGTLDGLLGWFECTLLDDIRMTNSPLCDDALARPQAFLPLEQPVPVSEGERIEATVMARPRDHVVGWTIAVDGLRHALSTFNGLLLDEVALDRSRPDRPARLNSSGLARQIVLGYCDGERTLAEVEARVLEDHPDLFPSQQATRAFVRSVLASDTGA